MEPREILKELAWKHPSDAGGVVEEAMRRSEELTPELLKLLAELSEGVEDYYCNYYAPIYAIYLLAYFREVAAYPLIIKTVKGRPDFILDSYFGPIITRDLPRILASVAGGDLGLVLELVEDEESGESVRSAALKTPVVLYAEGEFSYEDLVAYFEYLFGRLERGKNKLLWSHLALACTQTCPSELAEQLGEVFKEDLLYPSIISIQRIEGAISYTETGTLPEWLREREKYTLIGDLAQEFESLNFC